MLARILVLSFPVCSGMAAQAPPVQDALLDRIVGSWVLRGTIAGQSTTHDVDAQWVLGRQYIRMHEVSREKAADGQPAYEAIVFIGEDPSSDGYACLWLDTTSPKGLSGEMGHANKTSGDQIEFLFGTKTKFHTRFVYNREANSWRWLMDGEENGKLRPFARVELTPKRQ